AVREDPCPRRLPPGPDASHRRRLRHPRFRGRAGTPRRRAEVKAVRARGRRRDAPVARLRRPHGGVADGCAVAGGRAVGPPRERLVSRGLLGRDRPRARAALAEVAVRVHAWPVGLRARSGALRGALRARQPAGMARHPVAWTGPPAGARARPVTVGRRRAACALALAASRLAPRGSSGGRLRGPLAAVSRYARTRVHADPPAALLR